MMVTIDNKKSIKENILINLSELKEINITDIVDYIKEESKRRKAQAD